MNAESFAAYVYMCACVCRCVSACVSVWVSGCVFGCMCVYVCTYIHVCACTLYLLCVRLYKLKTRHTVCVVMIRVSLCV